MTTIERKLRSNLSYASFQSEQSVAKLLANAGWLSTHGLYYNDPLTQKHREIDVVARQIWKRKLKVGEQLVRITVLVEVKSMKGFHLLISEYPAESEDFFQHIHWFGDPRGKYLEVVQGLDALGVKADEIDNLVRRLHQYAYPGGRSRLWKMMIRPHPITTFTSFRETNLGTEKDLDNSVFWRASQNLRSAHANISDDIRKTHLDTLIGAAEFEASRSKDWISAVFWWAADRIDIVDIIHPIVVTDAKIWATLNGGPRNRGFARFGSHTYTGLMDWWCDLVNASHLERYIAKLTRHYFRHMQSAKARLLDSA